MSKQIKTIQDIRTSYIEFFEDKGHLKLESASLLPAQDPTLLFTTAGMVPFKNYFSGVQTPPRERVVSVQKCFRTTDLEEVGKTLRHLSFFEMLGNFSFGNYFKKEAIEFAWEYSTQYLPFDPKQIWVSVFRDDDEAYNIWRDHIGFPTERIVRLDEADNFWGPAGATGACGPCSELYIDRGEGYSFDKNNPKPGGEGDRFMEYWNLVFNQFNKNVAGKFDPLQQTGIDTGAGLERLATLVQGVDSVYDTDELRVLRDQVAKIYNAQYSEEQTVPIRVITDHARALTFAMSDGIFPSNESRGYVLRRMLRRGLLFGRKLGQNEPQLYKLVKTVNEIYGKFYTNLNESAELTEKYIKAEEERFLQTLDAGSTRLEEILAQAKEKQKVISGQEAFTLYDTFGFPLEMTIELAEQNGVQVDITSFHEKMEEQRERGRRAWKGSDSSLPQIPVSSTEFCGYDSLQEQVKLNYIVLNKENLNSLDEKQTSKDNIFFLVFDKTPFYAESGGQMGDSGFLSSVNNKHTKLEIIDTKKNGNQWIHIARNLEGKISVGETYTLQVDENRRNKLRLNHSATHLLNAALRKYLGEHIKQSGSLVHENYLRFDFTHPAAMQEQELFQVEQEVNQAIDSSLAVETKEMDKRQAKQTGATMTFGEKYGEYVRVVAMGNWDAPFSIEFCGGTHVDNTSAIDFFVIQKEGSPGAGNRRLEALTGAIARNALKNLIVETENTVKELQEKISLEEKMQAPKDRKKDNGKQNENVFSSVQEHWQQLQEAYKSFQAQQNSLQKQATQKAQELSAQWSSLQKIKRLIRSFENELKKLQKKKEQKGNMQIDENLKEKVLKDTKDINGFAYVFSQIENASIPTLKQMADVIREKNSSAVLLLFSTEQEKWNVVVATTAKVCKHTKLDMNALVKESLNEAKEFGLLGGGGGKKELAQVSGKINSNSSAVDSFVALLDKKLQTKLQ